MVDSQLILAGFASKLARLIFSLGFVPYEALRADPNTKIVEST
jgi:hypothetical protein